MRNKKKWFLFALIWEEEVQNWMADLDAKRGAKSEMMCIKHGDVWRGMLKGAE